MIFKYFKNVGVALSQLLHSLVGGDPKMTTSARIGKQASREKWWAVSICWVISKVLFDPEHCIKSYQRDRANRLAGDD